MEGFTLILLYLALPSLLFSAVKQILTWRKTLGSKPQFPGPRQFPWLGRVHDLPRYSLWLKFKEWADIYGPIYYTRVIDQTFIIVSDEKIAEELLVKRGHIYSGRPQIRSLIRHKEGPTYSALMDRHGEHFLSRGLLKSLVASITNRRASVKTFGRLSASGRTRPLPRPTSTTFTGT